MSTDFRLEQALSASDQILLDGVSYTITGAPIGVGGSALIYPATRPNTMMEYAIKECFPLSGNAHAMQFSRQNGVIRAADPADEDAALRLANYRKALAAEAQIGQELRNQSIRILGIWVQKSPSAITTGGQTYTDVQDGIYAVLERMDKKGLSFAALLQRLRQRFDRDFPLHSLVCMIKQTLRALQRVHDNGYLFGDIQQGNIFFCDCWPENGRVGVGCLMDFGCAQPLEPDGFTQNLSNRMVFSTPGYIPPELTPHKSVLRLGKQADIFSVGCLLLHCLLPEQKQKLLGACPRYDGQMMRKDVPVRLGCTPRVQKLLNKILEKAMAQKPADRYADAGSMLQDIDLLESLTEPPRYLLPANLSDPDYFHPGSRNQELQLLQRVLQDSNTVYLWGLGGIGKTELAVQLAKRCNPVRGAYLIHFKNSMRETILSLPFSGYKFCPADKKLSGEALIQAEYQERMEILRERYTNTLLIIDNLNVPGKTLDDLRGEPEFQEFLGLDLIRIFTTRYYFAEHREWEITPLSEESLLQLMRHFCTDPAIQDEELLQLIRAVDGHTLTVVLMAKILRESFGLTSPADILTALKNSQLSQADFPAITSEQNRVYSQKQIFAHLKALFDCSHLSETECNLLCCAAFLPDDGMQSRLFASCLPEGQGIALLSLVKKGWLQQSDDAILTIHPIVRDICLEELCPAAAQCSPFLDKLCARGNEISYSAVLYTQIAGCLANAANHLADAPADYALMASILYDKLGNYPLMLAYSQKALAIQEHASPPDDEKLASVYNVLGSAYIMLGSYEPAITFLEKASAIFAKYLPQTYSGLAMSYGNLGAVCEKKGNYPAALSYLEKALAIHEKFLPPEHPDLAVSYNNIGSICASLGDYKAALAYLQKALALREKILPPEHPDLAVSYSNIGSICVLLGNHKDALVYLKKGLAIREKILPPEHPQLAASYSNIGGLCQKTGDFQNALSYLEKALAIRKNVLSPSHPELAAIYNSIGAAYGGLGDSKTALSYLEKALVIEKKVLPPNHPDLAASYNGIGAIHENLHDYKTALPYLKKALAIFKKTLPSDHSTLAGLYNNISTAYCELGNSKAALSYLEKALAIQEKILPPEHPDLAASRLNIGVIYLEEDKYETALSYLEKARVIFEKVLSADHPTLMLLYNNLATAYGSLDDHKTALSYLEKALAIHKKSLSPNDLNLANLYNNISVAYDNLGDAKTALRYLEKALAIRKKGLSPNHPLLVATYYEIGIAYNKAGDHKAALPYLEAVLPLYKQILPLKDPVLTDLYRNIGTAYAKLYEYKKALPYLEKALRNFKCAPPPEDLALADFYNDIASAYCTQENFKMAVCYWKMSLSIFEKIQSSDLLTLAEICSNIGFSHCQLGEHKEALNALQKGLAIREKIQPPDHPDIVLLYHDIGAVYDDLDDPEMALSYLKKALDIHEKVPSLHPTDESSLYTRLSAVYDKLGDKKAHAFYMAKALTVLDDLLSTMPDL